MPEGINGGDCPEENIARGNLGTVKDGEFLVRFVWLGAGYVEDNRITPKNLSVEEFYKEGRDGWSFFRWAYIKSIAAMLESRAAQKPGRRYGYALISAAEIRAILDEENRRAICVIDAPEDGLPEHALAKRARPYGRQSARRIRSQLLEKFSEVKTA